MAEDLSEDTKGRKTDITQRQRKNDCSSKLSRAATNLTEYERTVDMEEDRPNTSFLVKISNGECTEIKRREQYRQNSEYQTNGN